ncbi:MAG: Ion transport protein [Verrucomicrobiales bacterium]|nr:Ion transport protein [Verrucomicrobiales bacterium]
MPHPLSLREKIRIVVFETDTPGGHLFDVTLLWMILLSVIAVIFESVPDINGRFAQAFYLLDWAFTLVFTVEYLLRVYSSNDRRKYVLSHWGVIDLLSVLPTYISLLISGYHYLLVIRILRLLRVFRVLKLVRFSTEAQLLVHALRASAYKIGVFISFMLTIVVLLSTLMYVVERGNPGFSSIPSSIYWGIVTITTVGFGDIVPHTFLGKFITSFIMLCGYSVIAIPTGIVTVELSRKRDKPAITACPACHRACRETDNFCSHCGGALP